MCVMSPTRRRSTAWSRRPSSSTGISTPWSPTPGSEGAPIVEMTDEALRRILAVNLEEPSTAAGLRPG